jgi:hypothetical protein
MIDWDKQLVKFDKTWLGLVLSIILPVITLSILFLYKFNGSYTFRQFISFMDTMQIMSKIFSLCVLPNLGLFFLFIWGNLLHGARGVIAGTLVVTFSILFVQFVL